MGSLLLELLPFAAGLAATPAAIVIGIVFLTSARPVANAAAFAAGFGVVYVVLSAIVLVIVGAAPEPLINESAKAAISLCVGLLLLGLALLRMIRSRGSGVPRKGGGFMDRAARATPRRAAEFGLVLAVLNPNVPILFAGLSVIAAAEVPSEEAVVGALFLLAGAELGLLGPIGWYLARRDTAAHGLGRVKRWLGRHDAAIGLAVLLVFGVIFAIKGLAGLV